MPVRSTLMVARADARSKPSAGRGVGAAGGGLSRLDAAGEDQLAPVAAQAQALVDVYVLARDAVDQARLQVGVDEPLDLGRWGKGARQQERGRRSRVMRSEAGTRWASRGSDHARFGLRITLEAAHCTTNSRFGSR